VTDMNENGGSRGKKRTFPRLRRSTRLQSTAPRRRKTVESVIESFEGQSASVKLRISLFGKRKKKSRRNARW
jgi:hypothetical protein